MYLFCRYFLAESDVVEIADGINTIFCEEHRLQMNTSFNAFQLNQMPEMSHNNRKHIRLKKSMTLPDDTLEYWGFFLPRGSTVELRACSLYEGSRILVVKGERNLRTCGLLDHNINKMDPHMAQGQGHVVVTFEEAAVVIDSDGRGDNFTNTKQSDDPEAYGGNGGEVVDDSDVVRRHSKILPHLLARENDFGSHSRNVEDDENEIVRKLNQGTVTQPVAEPLATSHKVRHHHDHANPYKKASEDMFKKHWTDKKEAKDQFNDSDTGNDRVRRDTVLDRGLTHGGSAINYTEKPSDSVSSFENGLLTCYDGQILLAQYFPPSTACHSVKFLDNSTRQGSKMSTKHEVVSDGYYYYIFYSDNDLVKNDIHAIFDIYKPTFQYSNISESKGCVNSTSCSFPLRMMSDERVIVEVPTRDGIEHEDDDITLLISTCVPRTNVYAIFPILVLLFILSCAFL